MQGHSLLPVLIIILSMLIQFAAAVSALRIIKITGPKPAWILIASALFLMALRRFIPLFLIFTNAAYSVNFFIEIIGLILSVLMFAGILGIAPVFLQQKGAEEQIRKLLGERELLLREVHHRIKNNMATVMGLLELQAGHLDNKEAAAALKDAGGRVRSMMLLYEKLYRSEQTAEFSAASWLKQLAAEITAGFPVGEKVRLNTDNIENFTVAPAAAAPLGILVNEILTNCMKHAFLQTDNPEVTVGAVRTSDRIRLEIADNGCGLPETYAHSGGGFGFLLIRSLVVQLKGSLEIKNAGGTVFIISFPAA